MPRQAVRTPYTKTLSALLKPDLVRLCNEFRLVQDGSVVVLRNRLKDYLNIHREALYRNPRFNALFPKHRRAINVEIPAPPSTWSPRSSPSRSEASSARSYASWNGIGDQDPPQQHDDLHFDDFPPFPDDVPVQHTPPPSPPPSPTILLRNSPPPPPHFPDRRE